MRSVRSQKSQLCSNGMRSDPGAPSERDRDLKRLHHAVTTGIVSANCNHIDIRMGTSRKFSNSAPIVSRSSGTESAAQTHRRRLIAIGSGF